MSWIKDDADSRQREVESALREAFAGFIEKREVEVILFSNVSALALAKAIAANPIILKSLLAACNIAARAIERDLSITNVDTYNPNLTEEQSNVIAGYIKPFLPPYLEIPALGQIDRVAFIDKEIRARKGRWEKEVMNSLNRFSSLRFCKRKFETASGLFELDAASPESGDIEFGIDMKRIEARRDIHKRCDEIANKASKLKLVFPGAKFGAVIYYPFIDEHANVQSRLQSSDIDAVVFASSAKESIECAVKMLLSALGVATDDE